MLREAARLVPWTSWDEWKQVSGWLWSSNSEEQLLGIKRVAAWKARGKIPVSIELTVNLLEVVRKDESVAVRAMRMLNEGFSSMEMRSELEKRMLYSMALTRMVNGLTAPYQQSYRAKSIAVICQMIGLPPSLVELRHEAAHAEIPSLAKLRSVGNECMHWLYHRYWMNQSTHFENTRLSTIDRCEKLAKLRKSLSADDALQRPHHASNKKESKSIVNQLANELTSSQVLTCLIPTLTKLIIPTQLQLSQLSRKYTEVPRRLQTMWMHIISKFAHRWPFFLPAILVSLVQNLFEATQRIPAFNLTLNPADVSSEAIKAAKFQISLLKCWYELLLDSFFEPSLSSAQVDVATQSSSNAVDSAPSAPKIAEKRKDALNPGGKLPNTVLPYKVILHLCFQHMNKHSVRFIKRTVCYMTDGPERDAILPKLKTLFHFRSRAINLTRAEQALASGGSMERALELERRVDANSEGFEASSSLSLEDFEKMLLLRTTPTPTPMLPPIIAPAPSPLHSIGLLPSRPSTATPTATILKKDLNGLHMDITPSPPSLLVSSAPITDPSELGDPQSANETPASEVSPKPDPPAPHPRDSVWTVVENIFPGIGLTPDGHAPSDLSLPMHLDEFRGATFLVPIVQQVYERTQEPTRQWDNSMIEANESANPEPGGLPLSPERLLLNAQGLVKRPPNHRDQPLDNFNGGKSQEPLTDLEAPGPKRRCLEEKSESPPQRTPTPIQPAIKVAEEKSKVKLMIKPKTKAKK
jgi:hypothetical protein